MVSCRRCHSPTVISGQCGVLRQPKFPLPLQGASAEAMPAMPVAAVVLVALLLAVPPTRVTSAALKTVKSADDVQKQGATPASKPAAGGGYAAATATGINPQPIWQRWEALYPSSKLLPVMGTLKEHQFVYQIPAKPTATLFVSPGCSHAATDWWPPSPACPSCLGLPEEVAQTQQALARGYAGGAGQQAGARGLACKPARRCPWHRSSRSGAPGWLACLAE